MRPLVSLLLALLLLLQCSLKLLVVASFEANRAWYAANLCENRQNPGSHCHGSCQLKKQLHEQERLATQLLDLLKEKLEMLPQPQLHFSATVAGAARLEFAQACEEAVCHVPQEVFRPPKGNQTHERLA